MNRPARLGSILVPGKIMSIAGRFRAAVIPVPSKYEPAVPSRFFRARTQQFGTLHSLGICPLGWMSDGVVAVIIDFTRSCDHWREK